VRVDRIAWIGGSPLIINQVKVTIITMAGSSKRACKAGWLLGTEGCLPSSLGAPVHLVDGKVTVTDGPFIES